jgi:hypothetical protein
MLFPGFEPMTLWSHGNSFTVAPGLPLLVRFLTVPKNNRKKTAPPMSKMHVEVAIVFYVLLKKLQPC